MGGGERFGGVSVGEPYVHWHVEACQRIEKWMTKHGYAVDPEHGIEELLASIEAQTRVR